ncbi:MAG: penicillin-binding protein activator [Gammaproteobacteria bacterium]|nr:penicillin-binding protein activator [Gammaproteobacteria bacterium]
MNLQISRPVHLLNRVRLGLASLFFAALMHGCGTPGPKLPEAAEPATLEGAARAEASDEYILAARQYVKLAESAAKTDRAGLFTRAAEAYIKGGQFDYAQATLKDIQAGKNQPDLRARQLILYARIAIHEGSNEKAARLLSRARKTSGVQPATLIQAYDLEAEVELALNNPVGAVKNLINRERHITEPRDIDTNQLKIWEILSQLPVRELRDAHNLAGDPVFRGWTDLALRQAKSPATFGRSLGQWKKDHSTHPVTETTLKTLKSPGPALIGRIGSIGILLPLSSASHAIKLAAEAVKEGIIAMDNASARPDKPQIRFYDTGDEVRQAMQQFAQAKKDGAQFIIGPLGNEAVDALVANVEIDVPTLFLSHTSREIDIDNVAVFQFGLTPEQEAKQAAEQAYVDGHRHAVTLYPQNPWGERMRTAFNEHWLRLGGTVLSEVGYNEDVYDHSQTIQQLFDINSSLNRKTRLETITRTRLDMEPRRRQDVDCVFLATRAKQGRLIKPQLNYYRAHQIPVYATSHIFTGRDDRIKDQDLNGIRFGDMPWMLIDKGDIHELRQLQGNWSYARTQLDRLYALGMDAYAVIPHLNRIGSGSGARFNGVTSSLSVDQEGRLHRQLVWAKFQRGVPSPLKSEYHYSGNLNNAAPGAGR